MEQTMVRGPRSGWREDEIDQLWREIQRANASGQPLRSVFEEMGGRLGRKPNSVRNYYYMQLRGQEGDTLRRAQPFETFTEAEVRSLLKSVLRARAQGQSVRACVMALSQGDHARMLRYQNKYRAVIKSRPDYVRALVERLNSEGVNCDTPHVNHRSRGDLGASCQALVGEAQRTGDTELARACDVIAKHLLGRREDGALAGAATELVGAVKDFLALPEEARSEATPSFCVLAAERMSRVEAALTDAQYTGCGC